MRLFRGTLLCLVVGVTAFGVAGWGFRPKPSWTLTIPKDDGPGFFVSHANENPWDDAPLLIDVGSSVYIGIGKSSDPPKSHYESRNPRTGVLLGHLSVPHSDSSPVVRDGLLYLSHFEPGLWDAGRTILSAFDNHGECVHQAALPGCWYVQRDSDKARRVECEPSGWRRWLPGAGPRLVVGVADLKTGTVERTVSFPGYSSKLYWFHSLSSDCTRLAVSESAIPNRMPPFGVEVIELGSDKRQRIPPPPAEERCRDWKAGCPQFSGGDRFLEYSWGPTGGSESPERRRYEFATGRDEREFSRRPPIPLPYGQEDDWADNIAGVSQLTYSLIHRKTRECWFLTSRDGKPMEWKRYPFPLPEDSSSGEPALFFEVPQRNQVVAVVDEPPLTDALPEALTAFAPKQWHKPQKLVRWNDWSRNVWRDAGSLAHSEGYEHVGIRPTQLLTFTWPNNLEAVLQSWPLPPRDPKWPALGVAALCAAATWWMCARRYRRRTRLVSVGAV
jgi:hypothetical protein